MRLKNKELNEDHSFMKIANCKAQPQKADFISPEISLVCPTKEKWILRDLEIKFLGGHIKKTTTKNQFIITLLLNDKMQVSSKAGQWQFPFVIFIYHLPPSVL